MSRLSQIFQLTACAVGVLAISACSPELSTPQDETSSSGLTSSSPLLISPDSATLSLGASLSFSASGGIAPYSYSVATGGGSVHPASGAFVAPASAGTTMVQVSDSVGNTNRAIVTTLAPLAISPSAPTLVVNGSVTFVASGGSAPYTYTVVSGGGSIHATTGLYTAPASSGSAVVRVTDSLGNTANAALTINPPLSITPASPAIFVNGSITFAASGGLPPYSYSVLAGGGSINAASGTYTAPATAGSATIQAADSGGNISVASVTIVVFKIVPSSKNLAVSSSFTFSATNGTPLYAYSIVSGGGLINSATGAYTAPATAGPVVIRVTDSVANTSDASVTVSAVAIDPSQTSLMVGNNVSFSANGGVGPYTYSLVSGTGSIHSTSGLYTAPGSAGSAVVRVTDSLSNTSNATVTIEPAIAISPSSKTVVVNTSFAFSGSGGVAPYSYSLVAGTGSVHATTGVYTAPGSSGSATVRITDSLGNFSNSSVTINPALAISPSSKSLAINDPFTFSATGGISPYTFSMLSGDGAMTAAGAYTAPASPGSAIARVTDSAGNVSYSTITISPALAISPASKTLAVNNVFSFSASGGSPPYSYAVFSGTGSIDSGSGSYTAPASSGGAVVRVTDSLGRTSDASVTINVALAISPASKTLAVNNSFTMSASGGVPPYTYAVTSGGGSINSSTGAYTAPASAGSVIVGVSDSIGNQSFSTVTVNAALAASPASKTLVPNQVYTFGATGGVAPYTFAVQSGVGSIHSTSGAYTAPAASGNAVIRITDSLSNTSDAAITINAALAAVPSSKTLAVNNSFTFGATGGISPYTYAVISGGGTVNSSTGAYTAPAAAGTATLRITDSDGNTQFSTITINPALAISPAPLSVVVNDASSFSASGGVAPYSYALFSGSGVINSSTGAYTAPASPGTDVVRVTDSLGNTSDSSITVVLPPAISPATKSLSVGNSFTFSASNGIPPYTYSVISGGGSIIPATGAYTAPANPGSATIRVTDSTGHVSDAAVTVNPAIKLFPPTVTLIRANTPNYTFSATGGVPPYSYSIVSGGGSVNSSTGLFTTPSVNSETSLRVTDSLGNSYTGSAKTQSYLVDGTVKAFAVDATSLYLGGTFERVNPFPAPRMLAVDATSGAPLLHFDLQSGFDGEIKVVLISGNSIYVGGSFSTYRGLPALRVAKLDATTGELDTTFTNTEGAGPNGTVSALVLSGSALYLGGQFTTYRGAAAQYLAKVDAATGSLDSTFTQAIGASSNVNSLAISGSSLYLGGYFTTYRGAAAQYLAKVDASTGNLDTSFTQTTGANGYALALVLSGSSLYLGGNFTTYRGVAAQRLAKVDATTGNLDTSFTQATGVGDNWVYALAISGSSLYLGGDFTTYRGATTQYLAKVDATTGNLDTTFTQTTGPGGGVSALAISGSSLYLGGWLTTYRGVTAQRLAKVDATTGDLDTTFTQATGAGGGVSALAISGSSLYVGGQFTTYRGVAARYLAKVNATTGILDSTFTQATGANSNILALAISGSSLYLGGDFITYRGVAAQRLAKVDATTGNLDTTFTQATGAGNSVSALAISGSSIYLGGPFTTYRGVAAQRLAKVDATTGNLDTTFTQATGANGSVFALVLSGSSLYLGGQLTTYRGAAARYLAKVDATTGNLDTTFTQATGAGNWVRALAISGSSLYLGGDFNTYRGATTQYLAKVDATTGNLDTTFTQTTGPGGGVSALAISGSSLYLGGWFTTYRGVAAQRLAKVDATTGDLDTTFTQATGANSAVFALAISGSSFYLGGEFTTYQGVAAQGLTKVDATTGVFDTAFMGN